MVRVGSLQERQSGTGTGKQEENKTNISAANSDRYHAQTAQLQEECDKYYAKALEALASDLDHLSKTSTSGRSTSKRSCSPSSAFRRSWITAIRSHSCAIRLPWRSVENTRQGRALASFHFQPDGTDARCKRRAKRSLHLPKSWCCTLRPASLAKRRFRKNAFPRYPQCGYRRKRGHDDHDIDYREIMTRLLKRRRKLAAVRLQITPAPAPEVERLLCNRLLLTHKRVFEQKSPI